MPNTFLQPELILNQALGILSREIVLPAVVNREARIEQALQGGGSYGDTVTLRLPPVATARELTMHASVGSGRTLTADDLVETSVDVTLDKHPYHLANITDEELTLTIEEFGVQVNQPQVRAVGEKMETYIADALDGGTYGSGTLGIGDPYDAAVDARAYLNSQNVPMGDRVLVVSPSVETMLLKTDLFRRADMSGSDSALREATIGRVAGMNVVVSNAITDGTAYAMHRSAVVFLNIAPIVPDGAKAGGRGAYQGLSLTWIRDYDPTISADRSLVHAYSGATLVADDGTNCIRAAKLAMAASIEITPGSPSMTTGDTEQLTATATLVDNTTMDVTSLARWSSDNESSVTVDEFGLLTADDSNTDGADITVEWGGETDTVTVSVS